jgi:hypothetical protein
MELLPTSKVQAVLLLLLLLQHHLLQHLMTVNTWLVLLDVEAQLLVHGLGVRP